MVYNFVIFLLFFILSFNSRFATYHWIDKDKQREVALHYFYYSNAEQTSRVYCVVSLLLSPWWHSLPIRHRYFLKQLCPESTCVELVRQVSTFPNIHSLTDDRKVWIDSTSLWAHFAPFRCKDIPFAAPRNRAATGWCCQLQLLIVERDSGFSSGVWTIQHPS